MTSATVVPPMTAYTLSAISFTRSVATLLATVDFTIAMTPTIPIMAGATFLVTIPMNE
jgi:hypothetical protein